MTLNNPEQVCQMSFLMRAVSNYKSAHLTNYKTMVSVEIQNTELVDFFFLTSNKTLRFELKT
jgi:hypothetical protein